MGVLDCVLAVHGFTDFFVVEDQCVQAHLSGSAGREGKCSLKPA